MLRTLGLALALLIAALAGLEGFWRLQGHTPAIIDDEDLWCSQRDRASLPNAVVLIGASRLAWGFSTDVIRRRFPDHPVVQLCDRWSPVAVLRDLSADESFRGVVLASVVAERLERLRWDDQQHLVDYCETQWTPSSEFNRALRMRLEAAFVIVNPIVGILEVGRSLVDGAGLPAPLWVRMSPDRSVRADFQARDQDFIRRFARRLIREHAQGGERPRPSQPREWLEGVKQIESFVQRIQARGGRVVFIRLPTAGRQWTLDHENYPKSDYWDALAEMTDARTIHFLDVPGMKNVELPDGSHPDWRAAVPYTELLLDELSKQGVLP
jgi:hypothetical protein